jgi:hypothetical protein
MASRVLEVLLQAKDQATAVLKKAEGALGSFKSGADRMAKGVSDGLNSMVGRFLSVGAIVGILSKSNAAANEFEASVRKLAGTAKIAGVPLEFLQEVAERGRTAFGLSAVLANDMTTAVSKLAAKAGDLGMTSDLMERFLDIGAAKGLSAADTLKAVEQSILGIDEGTDKLFGANPSVLYEEFAASIGKTAGKLTDQEKAMAIATAAMEDGAKVVGQYRDYLESTAGQQEQARQSMQQAAQTLGQALAPAFKAGAEAVSWLAEKLREFIGGLQIAAVDVGEWAAGIGPNLKIVAGALLTFLGDVFDKFRELPLVGDKFGELADKFRATGRQMVEENKFYLKALREETDKEREKIVGIYASSGKKVVLEARKQGDQQTEVSKEIAKELERIAEEIAVKTLQYEQGLTEKQAQEYVKRRKMLGEHAGGTVTDLRAAYAQLDQLNLLLAAGFDRYIVPAMKRTEGSLRDVIAASTDLPDPIAIVDRRTKAASLSFEEGARAAIGMAGGLGLIGAEASSALQNLTTLGTSIAKVMGGDPTALVGVIGGLTGILGGLFGGGDSPEERLRKQLIKENTEAIKELTDGIVDMSDVSSAGGLLVHVADVLQQVLPSTVGQSSRRIEWLLQQAGLEKRDLLKIADDLGIKVTDDKGNILDNLLPQLLQAINSLQSEGARFEWDEFRSWLDAALTGGAVDPTDVWGQALNQMLTQRFGGGALEGLSGFDVTTAEGKAGAQSFLRDLLTNLPSLTPEQLGGFNFSDFAEAIQFFLEQLDVEGVGTGWLRPRLPGQDLDANGLDLGSGPTPPVTLNLPDLSALGAQQVDYLGSIDTGISGLTDAITRWVDIDTGRPRRVTVTVGDVYVQGAPTTAETGLAVREAVQAAIDEALAEAYLDSQLTQGNVTRTV